MNFLTLLLLLLVPLPLLLLVLVRVLPIHTAYRLLPTAYTAYIYTAYCLYCLLPTSTAYCLLPTAYCLLPTAYSTAYCLLPTAYYCLLPTAFYCCLLPCCLLDAYTACAAHCLLPPTAYRLYTAYRLMCPLIAYTVVQYLNTCFSSVQGTAHATSTCYLLPTTRTIDTSATYYSTSAPSKVQNQHQNKPPPAPRPKWHAWKGCPEGFDIKITSTEMAE